MPRVLLLLPTTTYRTQDFLDAAERVGVDVTVACEKPSTMERLNPAGLLTLDFSDPVASARRAAEFAKRFPIDAVLGVDDDSTVPAAAIAERLGLAQNSVNAALAAKHKATLRARLAEHGVAQPGFHLFRVDEGPSRAAALVSFPCVAKPTFLSASRGVIRANDPSQLADAWLTIQRILAEPDVVRKSGPWREEVLIEDYVPGIEVALEGILREGELSVLALFDKPDPLEGPYFEETIYVTPSRLPEPVQREIVLTARRACFAIGLTRGPIHAELRWHDGRAFAIEVAGRSIGGLCSRALRLRTGMSLEELILRDALSLPVPEPKLEETASGVLMIPTPRAGVLEGVSGVEEAKRVPGIENVTITAHLGQRVAPPPDGWHYLGFIFSRALSPEAAEASLREAHAKLRIEIAD